MAETAAPIKDFASMAIESMTVDPETPVPTKPADEKPAPKPTEKPEKKSGIPDQLFSKPETKPADEKPAASESESEVDKIAEPNFKDPKNKGGWDTLKGKAKELETKYGEAQKRLGELEAKGKDTEAIQAKLAQIEKDHAELGKKYAEREKLALLASQELDPEWRSKFVDGRQSIIDRAKKIIDDSGGDAKAIETAMNLKGKARVDAMREVADNLSPYEASRLGRAIDELDALDTEAQTKRGNPEEYLKERTASEQARAKQEAEQFQQTMGKAFRDAEKTAADKFIMAKKLEGVDWWNEGIDKAMGRAKNFWETNTDPKAAAERNIKAELYDIAEQGFADMRAERDTERERANTFEKELEKLHGRSPRLNGGDVAAAPKGDKGGDFASRVIESAQLRQ